MSRRSIGGCWLGWNAKDLRTKTLVLTEQGKAIYDKTFPIMSARQQRLAEALGPERLADFKAALEILDRTVSEDERKAL